jgi:hypothetical protein
MSSEEISWLRPSRARTESLSPAMWSNMLNNDEEARKQGQSTSTFIPKLYFCHNSGLRRGPYSTAPIRKKCRRVSYVDAPFHHPMTRQRKRISIFNTHDINTPRHRIAMLISCIARVSGTCARGQRTKQCLHKCNLKSYGCATPLHTSPGNIDKTRASINWSPCNRHRK